MAVSSTVIFIVTTGTEYRIPGDWSAQQVKTNYADQISGITSMVPEEELTDNEDGSQTRRITFRARTGNKG